MGHKIFEFGEKSDFLKTLTGYSLKHIRELSNETQLLCLISGANSIFYGDSLLTTKNNDMIEDKKLISIFKDKDKSISNKYL